MLSVLAFTDFSEISSHDSFQSQQAPPGQQVKGSNKAKQNI